VSQAGTVFRLPGQRDCDTVVGWGSEDLLGLAAIAAALDRQRAEPLLVLGDHVADEDSQPLRELRRLGPALVSGSAPSGTIATSNVQPCQAIDLIAKTYQNHTYVVAINRKAAYTSRPPWDPAYDPSVPRCSQFPIVPDCGQGPVSTEATFQLTGHFVGPVQVLGESRQLSLNGGGFTDQFPPLGVHIYRVYTDQTAPSVSILSPSPGAIFKRNKRASIIVSAADDTGVDQITLTITTVPAGTTIATMTQTIAPAQQAATRTFSWTPSANGDYTLSASARDVFGQSGSSAVNIRVTNSGN
jgi:hypothetical protein